MWSVTARVRGTEVDPAYAAAYPDLYARHWWWRERERSLLDRLARVRTPDGTARILDVGCGDGTLLDRLAPWGWTEGVETDPITLSPAAAKRRIHLGPFDKSYRPAAPFDLILFLDVLEHIEDPAQALARAGELLVPEGRIVVTVPAFPILWTRHDVLNHHKRRYTIATIRALAGAVGLEVGWWRYLFFSVGLAKLLVRAKEALVAAPPATPKVPSAPLNAIAGAVARLDLAIGGMIPLPFGSSLFAVLQRPALPGSGRPG